ncbi:SH3 domain-containing protein [Lacrimispora algidixylanolytica]|uniref:hypothetical protein n=1 Tax=Lacrimispora algidixylanolytica TaxID=94868 RepID=UPI002ED67FCF
MAFSNNVASLKVDTVPSLDTEVAVANVSNAVIAGNEVKVDYSLNLSYVTTADYEIAAETRLYRDGTLLETREFNQSGSTAGTHTFAMLGTYVDIAPATTTSTYEIRIITTTAINVTSVSAVSRNINLLIF